MQVEKKSKCRNEVPARPAAPLPPAGAGDFLRKPRVFPPGMSRWRADLLTAAARQEGPLTILHEKDQRELRDLLDEYITRLSEIDRILRAVHGTPDLGNLPDPLDELIYIILARKTRESAYQETFRRLKARFPAWEDVLNARAEAVVACVRSGGLGEKKARSIRGALETIRARFGRCTLEPLRGEADEEILEFLRSLPEIEHKSAYCVMLYSLGRRVFPVDTHVGRVLGRMAPFRSLAVDVTGKDHKQLQRILPPLVPPELRHSLHVNLVLHGRTTCLPRNPRCDDCDVRKLCNHYRARRQAAARASRAPTFVDLFSGCGGFSTGFVHAGFRPLLAVERDPSAAKTYWLNHPELPDDRLLVQDILTIPPRKLPTLLSERVDVLVASPPCEGFSTIGQRARKEKARKENREFSEYADARNHHFEDVIAWARVLRPAFVVMENVTAIRHVRHGQRTFLDEAAHRLSRLGYNSRQWVVNAAAFGIPQERVRCFLVATRLSLFPPAPAREYRDSLGGDQDVDSLPPVTLMEAIGDLPPLGAAEGSPVTRWTPPNPEAARWCRRYLTRCGILNSPRLLFNHRSRYQNESDLQLFAALRPGENSVDAIRRHGLVELMRYRRDAFDDKYYRLPPDRPCRTIVSHLAKDGNSFIHPVQVRNLTVREAARVQGFPDDHPFCGAFSEQFAQVGDAVPPPVARAIAESLREVLLRMRGRGRKR